MEQVAAQFGIVTLAAFTPGDAFAYWQSLGLKVDPNRIAAVDIDGGRLNPPLPRGRRG